MNDELNEASLSDRLRTAAEQVRVRPDVVEVELGARRHRARRRAGLGVAAAMLVAGAAGAGFGLGRAVTGASDDQLSTPRLAPAESPNVSTSGGPSGSPSATAREATERAVQRATAERERAEADAQARAAEGGAFGSVTAGTVDDDAADMAGYEVHPGYELVLDRTLESGLTVRVHRGQSYGGHWEPDSNGWAPEPWCYDESEGRIAVAGDGVIDVSWFAYRNGATRPIVHPVDLGWADGVDIRAFVIQSDAATEATVVGPAGQTDTATAADGTLVVVLTGDGPFDDYELTITTPDGPVVMGPGDGFPYGGPEWEADCHPPPPELPQPGEQPVDADAAEAEIRANVALVYDQTVDRQDKPDHLLDDWTGVAEAQAAVGEAGFADAAASAAHTVEELVFTSPTEAWFRYRLDTSAGAFTGRFGVVRFIDGNWSLVRATLCQDLALAGGTCADGRHFQVMPGSDVFEFPYDDVVYDDFFEYPDHAVSPMTVPTTMVPLDE